MIYLGQNNEEKKDVISKYSKDNNIDKIYFISPKHYKFNLDSNLNYEIIEWDNVIMYKFFYRLLQEININSLVVINECLVKKQRRGDLTYNCIRHYLNQAGHQLIFQYLPIIDEVKDFYTLIDFDTKSMWKLITDKSIFTKTKVPAIFSTIHITISPTSKFVMKYREKMCF